MPAACSSVRVLPSIAVEARCSHLEWASPRSIHMSGPRSLMSVALNVIQGWVSRQDVARRDSSRVVAPSASVRQREREQPCEHGDRFTVIADEVRWSTHRRLSGTRACSLGRPRLYVDEGW